MARAILLSGSYMVDGKHWAGPPPAAFDAIRLVTPNISGRMDNLRAAILRPQLCQLESQCRAWNTRYHVVDSILANMVGLAPLIKSALPADTTAGPMCSVHRCPQATVCCKVLWICVCPDLLTRRLLYGSSNYQQGSGAGVGYKQAGLGLLAAGSP
jgi:hypothetical protein